MNNIIPNDQKISKNNVNFDLEAMETIQNIERYSLLKSIEECNKLIKKIIEVSVQEAGEGNIIKKSHIQKAFSDIMDK